MHTTLRIAPTTIIPARRCPWVIAALRRTLTQARHCSPSALLTAGDWGVLGSQRERQRCKRVQHKRLLLYWNVPDPAPSPPHMHSKHSVALERWNAAHMPKWLFIFPIVCTTQTVEHLAHILPSPLCTVKGFLSAPDLLLFSALHSLSAAFVQTNSASKGLLLRPRVCVGMFLRLAADQRPKGQLCKILWVEIRIRKRYWSCRKWLTCSIYLITCSWKSDWRMTIKKKEGEEKERKEIYVWCLLRQGVRSPCLLFSTEKAKRCECKNLKVHDRDPVATVRSNMHLEEEGTGTGI